MKKKVFGIVLFLVFGFFIFTFANPKDNNDGKDNNDIIKPTPTATANVKEETKEEVNNNEEQNNEQQENTNNQNQNNNGGENVVVTPTATPYVPQPTAAPVPTATPVVPVPTIVPTPTPSATPVVTPTAAPEPTSSPVVPVPTVVPTPTPTPTATSVVPTPTSVPVPTIVPTPTSTAMPTTTPEPTVVPQPTPSATPVVTPTSTPVVPTPTATPVVPEPTTEPEEDLTDEKNKAKEELKNYNKDELYSDENQEKVDNIKEDGYKEIDDAKTLDEIKEILKEKEDEIDKIQKLTDTYFDVTFVGFDGSETTQQVLYDNDAVAPKMDNEILNGVTYVFDSWDKEFTHIKENTKVTSIYKVNAITAKVYLETENGNVKLGNINLIVTEDLTNIATANENTKVSEIESDITGMVIGTLPTSNKQNYKYTFNSLDYVENEGFIISGIEEIDEEELAKNTVTIKYVINDNATFADGTKEKEVTTYTGSNTVNLPEVYRNNKVVNVNWTDSNNELKEVYTSSVTITATLDKTAPVITLNGKVNREVLQSKDVETYTEEGFTVTDNYTRLTNEDVKVTITKDGQSVNSVTLNVPGTYVITYTVEDTEGNIGTATRTIVVTAAKLVNIQLSSHHGEYFVGDKMENITVTAHYNHGVKVEVTDYEVEGFDTTTPTTGNKTAVVKYQGQTANYTYKVKAIEVERIELSEKSGEYFVGDKMHDITVTAYYNNNTSKVVTDYELTGFDTSKEKNNLKATFTYEGKKAEYKYNVKAVKLEKITLSETSGEYFVGDKMHDITVTAHYNNGTSKVVTAKVTGFNTSKAKNNLKATFTYEGKKAEYKYNVKAVVLESITLSKTSGEYFVGDSMENITVTAHYNNGKTKTLEEQICFFTCSDGYSKTSFSSSKAGSFKVTYTYEGKKAEYNYTVKAVVLENITLSKTEGTYYVGDNMENITVTAHYNNGKTKTLEEQTCFFTCSDGYTKTSFSSAKAGSFKVTYNYEGKTADYNYTVNELVAKTITLSKTTGTYIVGDKMDSIKVTVTYNNGKTKDVTSLATISGFNTTINNVGNNHTATVTYDGVSATYTYDVKYYASIVSTNETVGHGHNAHSEKVYYLEFILPANASIVSMVRTDANGTSYTVTATKKDNKYYISETDYTEIKKMKGNNANQKFVVTYKLNGKEIVSTYTRVVEK